jgi:opacity protein-like surface antigen
LLNERDRAGRAPRTLESVGEQSVDLGGSYRLTPRIDVTAGVRYSQDRDRLKPPSETKADNQAVYVGTQFRF